MSSKNFSTWVETLTSLVWKITITIGMFISFFYCVSEEIFPDGLSFGDVFILVWVAMGCGLLMLLGTAYGITAALLPLNCASCLVRKINLKNEFFEIHPFVKGKWWVFVSLSTILVFGLEGVIAFARGAQLGPAVRTILFFSLYGFMLLCVFNAAYFKRQSLSFLPTAMLTIGFFIACLPTTKPPLLNLTMSIVGIRLKQGALIVVSDPAHERLSELAQQSGLTIDFCQLPHSSKWATLDARVLWHNVGSTSYISLLDRATAGERSLHVPIPRGDLEVIRAEQVSLTCKDTLGYKPLS